MTARPKNADVHRQALLAAAIVAAEVRDEAEDDPPNPRMARGPGQQEYRAGWYEAADKIAKGILELAEAGPPPEGAPAAYAAGLRSAGASDWGEIADVLEKIGLGSWRVDKIAREALKWLARNTTPEARRMIRRARERAAEAG